MQDSYQEFLEISHWETIDQHEVLSISHDRNIRLFRYSMLFFLFAPSFCC